MALFPWIGLHYPARASRLLFDHFPIIRIPSIYHWALITIFCGLSNVLAGSDGVRSKYLVLHISFCDIPFFANTGAVAGVFTVVGLIVLVVIIALVTNGIRRRRARKFDQELAEATREAASAPNPVFLDDEEDDRYGRGGYGNPSGGNGGGGGQFSDVSSHGTYGQPAMSVGHGQESYGMREMGQGVGPGEIYDPYAAGAAGAGSAGAAGIGVARARSMQRSDGSYAAALQDGGSPYAAFAAPTGQSVPSVPDQYNAGGRNPNLEILEAAGMGAHVTGAGMLARGQSQYNNTNGQQQAYNSQYQPYSQQPGLHQRAPSSEYANVDRSRSMTNREGAMPVPAGAYASHYQQQGGAYQQQPQQYQPQGQQQAAQHGNRYSVSGDDEDDAYGGYIAEGPTAAGAGAAAGGAGGNLPNPFEGATSSAGHGKHEYDERDNSDEEDEPPRRVLKVANE
ncbi:hypothetical protein BDZ97DRAFT_1758371 [Flammula alnicola]|nr:hypothetical protein BDZ97DRAFT_1758371 [Flammula alnicola]